MPSSVYPNSTHLSTFFSTSGIAIPSSANLEMLIGAAVKEFEKRTGRKMLVGAAAEERKFDPPVNPRGFLNLEYDLFPTPTPIVKYSDTTLDAEEYRFEPINALSLEVPYTSVQFWRRWIGPITSGIWGALSITGKWGYSDELDDDVFNAMLELAAIRLFPQAMSNATGGLQKWSQGRVSETYGELPNMQLYTYWHKHSTSTIRRYKRASL